MRNLNFKPFVRVTLFCCCFILDYRIAEAAQHSMGNFLQREHNWFLRVIGKGKKLREIPMPDELLTALTSFRVSAGLPSPLPRFREKTPLNPMQNFIIYMSISRSRNACG